jgi:hypothetical protein
MKKSAEELLTTYRRLRRRLLHLHSQLTKQLPKEAIESGGKQLGIMHNGVLVLATMDESSVLMDHCLHTYRVNGKTVLEHYIEDSSPSPESDDFLLLSTLVQARYSMFQIEDIMPGLGAVIRDLLRGDEIFIVDVGLSESAKRGFIMACRIFAPTPDFFMTTGTALPVDRDGGKLIVKGLESKFLISKPDVRDFTHEEMSGLSAFITRTLLASGASEHIRYESKGESRHASAASAGRIAHHESRPDRNESCPCGSGRKYKHCCGR